MTQRRIVGVIAAILLSGSAAQAQLIINPTFDSTITSDPNAATIEVTINTAIGIYKNTITTPITVNITFAEMTTGLGQSSTFFSNVNYSDYYNALNSNSQKSANDITALAHLSSGPNSPVPNTGSTIDVTTANLRALSLGGITSSDSTISLNTSLMNLSRSGTQDPGKYDLQAVAMHEINEALGLGSNLDDSTKTAGPVRPMDLFRYDGSGVRSYTTSTTAQAYFSIDGTRQIVRFNQDPSGDRGDWYSPGGQTPRVQDAFGTPGAQPDLGDAELTALDVIGYTLAPVPEPAWMLALAAPALGWLGWRRQRQAA